MGRDLASRTSANRPLRRIVLAIIALSAMAVWMVGAPASAETIDVPIDSVVKKGDPGSTIAIGQATVPAELVGRSCEVAIEVTNQESVNPGNQLVVTSDGSTVTVDGVEDEAGAISTKAGTITLGATIDVSIVLGPNSQITSLGSSLTVTCEPLPPTPPAPTVVTRPVYTG